MKSHLGLFVMIKKETNLHQAVFMFCDRSNFAFVYSEDSLKMHR